METPKTEPNASAHPVEYPGFWEHNGLTKRETMFIQFAASAPQEIPRWFDYKRGDRPEPPTHWSSMKDGEDKLLCKNWHDDPCWELRESHEHLAWYQDAWDLYQEKCREVDQRDQIQYYFTWRMHYAQMMTDYAIETLNKPSTDEPGA